MFSASAIRPSRAAHRRAGLPEHTYRHEPHYIVFDGNCIIHSRLLDGNQCTVVEGTFLGAIDPVLFNPNDLNQNFIPSNISTVVKKESMAYKYLLMLAKECSFDPEQEERFKNSSMTDGSVIDLTDGPRLFKMRLACSRFVWAYEQFMEPIPRFKPSPDPDDIDALKPPDDSEDSEVFGKDSGRKRPPISLVAYNPATYIQTLLHHHRLDSAAEPTNELSSTPTFAALVTPKKARKIAFKSHTNADSSTSM